MSRPSRLPYVLVPGLVIVAGAFASQACGGSQQSDDPPPVCYASQPIPDGGMMRPLRPNEWAQLIVGSGYRDGQTSSQNCAGHGIEWHATDRRCDVREPDDEPAPRAVPITEESVIVGRADNVAIKPVWIITHHFENGDGFGPVAVTERTAEGVAVRAIGTLRLPIERARLRLRDTGGQRILVADGERCPHDDEEGGDDDPDSAPPANADQGQQADDAQPATCLRTSRILPMVGDELLNPEVRSPEGQCLGPASIYLTREHVVSIANGWERVFRLAASMEYVGGSIVVHEQVTAEDRDPRDPGRPPLPFRTTDGDRIIVVDRGGMRSSGIPLFERTIRAQGSTQLPIAPAPNNGEQSGSGRGQQR